MKTKFFKEDDFNVAFSHWNEKSAFVKDYVKSLKIGVRPIVSSQFELDEVISKMKHYRGKIEGGLVLRSVVDLDETTEKRFFVLNGTLHANSGVSDDFIEYAQKVMESTNGDSSFYSIDLVKDITEKVWLVEIGDGQVSDPVGWEINDFSKIFKSLISNDIDKRIMKKI